MYTIYAKFPDDESYVPIHHQILEYNGTVCVSPKLTEHVNAHGSLEFTVYPTNPEFDRIATRKVFVKVYEDADEIWRGRVINISRNLDNAKKVYCEGEMAYLCDTIQFPISYTGTAEGLLQKLLTKHNSEVPNSRKIYKGTVTAGTDSDGNKAIIEVVTDKAQSTWSAIQSTLIKQFAGYLRTRKVGDTIYLDWLKDFVSSQGYPLRSNQEISYGKNLISFTEKTDCSDIITVLLPYGAKKNTAPILYKRRSANSLYFDRLTEDVAAGEYLIYANGGALSNIGVSGATRLTSNLLDYDHAQITVDSTQDTIKLLNVANAVIWTFATATVPAPTVEVSGNVTRTISLSANGNSGIGGDTATITQNINLATDGTVTMNSSSSQVASVYVYAEDEEDGEQQVGYTRALSIGTTSSGSQQSSNKITTEVKKDSNDAWFITSVYNGTTWYLCSTGKERQLGVTSTFNAANLKIYWQISNNENGCTITNKFHSDRDIPGVLHGDVDDGWALYDRATGDIAAPPNKDWDGGRVNIKRANSGIATVTSDDGIRSFGYIYGTKVFDSITTPFELKAYAENYIYKAALENVNVSANAVDLSFSSTKYNSISVGMYSQIVSKPLGISLLLLCVEKKTFLSEPDKTTVQFGIGQQTLTDIQGGQTANVRYS